MAVAKAQMSHLVTSKEVSRDYVALPAFLQEGLSRAHLPGLDGVRMVAAFLVVFYHFGFERVPGPHGVLVFFVLSGFLITRLLLKEGDRYGRISLRLFYCRRALRIFPAFYTFWVLLTAALLLFNKPIVLGQAISAFAYVGNYYQPIMGDPSTGYSHTWSLAIEEQFYLLWPLSLIGLRRKSERMMVVLTVIIGCIWVYRAVLELAIGVRQEYVFEAFDTRVDQLLMGCLLAIVLHEGRGPRIWKWLCRPWVSLGVVGALAGSICMGRVFGAAYRNVVGFAIDPVLVAVLVPQVIALRETALWRWLNWRWVCYLGTISYSIYLYQQVLMDPVRKVLLSYPLLVQVGAAVGVVVLTASLSYHFIERPFLRLKDRLAKPRRSRCSAELESNETDRSRRQSNGKDPVRIVLAGYYPPPLGGESVHVRELAQRLRAEGLSVEVINTRRGAHPSHDYRTIVGPADLFCALLKGTIRGSVVHLHTNGHSWKSWVMAGAAAAACRLRRRRSMLTLHSGLTPGYLAQLGPLGHRAVRWSARGFHHVICVNTEIRRAVAGLGVRDCRLSVIPAYLGVPALAVLSAADARMVGEYEPLLATAGGPTPEYGLTLLIEATAKLRTRLPRVGCMVMGASGDLRSVIERLGVTDCVRCTGELPHERYTAIVSRADVFVRPSYADGDAVSVREALDLGVPVVASDTGLRPPGVVLFALGDVDDLCQKILYALERGRTPPMAASVAEPVGSLMTIYRGL